MRYLMLAVALLLPASGLAQKDPPRTQVFVFDDPAQIIADGVRVPVIYIDADQRVKFDRLMKLKKDFLPKLRATAKAEALR